MSTLQWMGLFFFILDRWLYQTCLHLLKNADARLSLTSAAPEFLPDVNVMCWHNGRFARNGIWTTSVCAFFFFVEHQVFQTNSLPISGVTKTTSVDRHQWQRGTNWLGRPMIGIFKMKPAYNFRCNRPTLSEKQSSYTPGAVRGRLPWRPSQNFTDCNSN